MQYFFVQNKAPGQLCQVQARQFSDLEAAQRSAVANVRDLISDALTLGQSHEDISIEIWEESGPVVSVVQSGD